MVLGQPGQIVRETLSQKRPTQKRAGRVVQMIEHLPSKCEAQSSNCQKKNHNVIKLETKTKNPKL
jgi:metal-responsive CopG/Arc/MetJ family transcriptional regulator